MKAINTLHAPHPDSAYTQAIATETLLFISGQIGQSPNEDYLKESIEAQCEQAIANIEAILLCEHLHIGNVIKINIYLTNIEDLPKVEEIYTHRFGAYKPARSVIGITSLPKEALVQMDAIATYAVQEKH